MGTIIISNDMTQPYSQIVTKTLQKFGEYGVNKTVMVGLSENKENTIMGYYNMDTFDKMEAASHILSDAIMDIVCANIDVIKEKLEDKDG